MPKKIENLMWKERGLYKTNTNKYELQLLESFVEKSSSYLRHWIAKSYSEIEVRIARSGNDPHLPHHWR